MSRQLTVEQAVEERSYTLFAWVQVAPSVRAGYRLPAERVEPFKYVAAVPKTMEAEGLTLEITHRSGRRVPLWTTSWGFHRHVVEGDSFIFQLTPEGQP